MTHTRQYADSEGDFGGWQSTMDSRGKQMTCSTLVDANPDVGRMQPGPCGALVFCRLWESSDGAYEDYQYRCERGHIWWVDGIDS